MHRSGAGISRAADRSSDAGGDRSRYATLARSISPTAVADLILDEMADRTSAGFFPAATYLVSAWYCRFEVQTRIGIFYCAASLAGAFSGLLAFAISKMDGVANLAGWRWIFILEGLVTVLTGLFVFWQLPNSPETASWLTSREKQFIRFRLEQDAGTTEGRVNTTDKFQFKYLIRALTDWKLWFTVFIYWGST